MNTDFGDSSVPDDHGLIMDSASATHDDTGENLDLILDASIDDPSGTSGSQQPSSTVETGDLRCINCGLNVSRMRRHSLEIAEVRSLIQRWVGLHQVQVSSDSLVCHTCWTNAWDEIRHSTRPKPIVGHVSVCISCGTSLLRKRSHRLNTDTLREAGIRNMIAQQIAPRQLLRTTLLCHICWRRTDRAPSRSILVRELPSNSPSLHSTLEEELEATNSPAQESAEIAIDQLVLIACGTYQLKQARSYYGEHRRFNGCDQIEICTNTRNRIVNENIFGPNCLLLRARIASRHVSRKVYFVCILISTVDVGRTAIKQYCCNCIVGRRTVGCCAHVMAVIWYLGWARHQSNIVPPAQYFDDVLVIYDQENEE